MNNAFLQALQQMAALNTTPEKKVVERPATKISRNPDGMSLRVYKDGSVFPSQALVDRFNLEYQLVGPHDVALGIIPQGLDVFLSHDLPNFNKQLPNVLLVAPAAKNESKVDLFKQTDYQEDGTPKSSVLSQGSSSFGKNHLLPMLEVALGKESAEIFASQKFVDLVVEVDYPLPIAGDFLYLPKRVSKGVRAGEIALVRRPVTRVYPLTVSGSEDTPSQTELEGTSRTQELEHASTVALVEEELLHT